MEFKYNTWKMNHSAYNHICVQSFSFEQIHGVFFIYTHRQKIKVSFGASCLRSLSGSSFLSCLWVSPENSVSHSPSVQTVSTFSDPMFHFTLLWILSNSILPLPVCWVVPEKPFFVLEVAPFKNQALVEKQWKTALSEWALPLWLQRK